MTVENSTIIIGISTIIIWYMIYTKLSKLFGGIAMMSLGVLTYMYSETGSTDATAYGIYASIIFGTGIIMLINYLFEPITTRK